MSEARQTEILEKKFNTKTYKTTELVASGVIKADKVKLYQISGINDKASDQYIQVFNSKTVPDNGTVPDDVISVPTKANFSKNYIGRDFPAGLCWSNSSTLATKTIGSADCWVTASYGE